MSEEYKASSPKNINKEKKVEKKRNKEREEERKKQKLKSEENVDKAKVAKASRSRSGSNKKIIFDGRLKKPKKPLKIIKKNRESSEEIEYKSKNRVVKKEISLKELRKKAENNELLKNKRSVEIHQSSEDQIESSVDVKSSRKIIERPLPAEAEEGEIVPDRTKSILHRIKAKKV